MKKIVFALTGSFCNHKNALKVLEELVSDGTEVQTVVSYSVSTEDTRFGKASDLLKRLEELTGRKPILTIPEVESEVTNGKYDLVFICPCTGNTAAKLASGITDTPVLMAAKSQLRNNKPVLIAFASNDGLSSSGKNIAYLREKKNVYFVPFKQDDPINKPNSLVAEFDKAHKAVSDLIK